MATTGTVVRAGTAADGATIKEGSYLLGTADRLMQIVDGEAARRRDQGGQGQRRHPRPQRARSSAPCCRSATRCAMCCAPRPPTSPGRRRRSGCASPTATSSAASGRSTTPSSRSRPTPETGEERETHRRPNLAPFADDPDCWLVASIEDYDLESGLARMGPIFRERVIAPPSAPLIATAADALAVTLNETGRVDIDHLAELLDRDPRDRPRPSSATAVFRNPRTEAWETDDAYLSGSVRTKLADGRGGGRARPAVCAQRGGAAAGAARGPAAVGHHGAARRAVDSRRRHRGLRRPR